MCLFFKIKLFFSFLKFNRFNRMLQSTARDRNIHYTPESSDCCVGDENSVVDHTVYILVLLLVIIVVVTVTAHRRPLPTKL